VIWRLHADFRDLDVDVQRHTDLAVEGQKATTLFVGAATIDRAPSGFLGVASEVDFGNDNATDVGFVSRTWEGTDEEVARFAANTAAHEAGHTFGLRHVDSAGLNDHMRLSASPSTGNAKNEWRFLDQSLNAAEFPEGSNVAVHAKDAN